MATVTLLCVGVAFTAGAQSLKEKVTGAWTLQSGSENYPDGKKRTPWATGSLILESTGHVSLFLIGNERLKNSPSVRTPIGPAVAYYGTYTVDEGNNMLVFKIAYGMSPLFDGVTRTQKVSFNDNIMTTIGSDIMTPEGAMIPVNEWKRAK
jgi:hypothetical protein